MKSRDMASVALHATFVCLAVLGFAVASPSKPVSWPACGPALTPMSEPPFAAAYLAAYARGDEAMAEQVASPLYRLEWAHRGVSVADRQALISVSALDSPSGEWLNFTYVGGAVDWRGFGRLLYLARPERPGAASPGSVWRVDTAPDGRVIWVELVYLFSPESSAIAPVLGGADISALAVPDTLAKVQPCLVVGVRALAGREGYYAVAVPPATVGPPPAVSDVAVVFFGIDASGGVRPGAWSYGNPNVGPSEYGRTSSPPPVALDLELAALERSYVETL